MRAQKATADARSEPRSSLFHHITASLRRHVDALFSQPYQYESARRVFGLPLLGINVGPPLHTGQLRHARGIVALGTSASGVVAIGLLIARGIVAVAPIAAGALCVGVACLGLLSVAVLGLGLLSVSVFAFGYVAVGILAMGYKAVGIVAFGVDCAGIVAIGKTARTLMRP